MKLLKKIVLLTLVLSFTLQIKSIAKGKVATYDIFNMFPVEVIVPENQTEAQSLSIVVTDNIGNLIVFDGGREGDADYLVEVIKNHGGVVKDWFLTHIHDDHIGALYRILKDKRTDIKIENIVCQFADFAWYYKVSGDTGVIVPIFEQALAEYNAVSTFPINYRNNDGKMEYNYGFFNVRALNKMYKIESNEINVVNNSSIVYLLTTYNNVHMIVFGDLGYEGGDKLFSELKKEDMDILKNTEIVVLSHHGQYGVRPEVYKLLNPKVVIWPTNKYIYYNSSGRLYVEETKEALRQIESLKYQIKSYEETAVIR